MIFLFLLFVYVDKTIWAQEKLYNFKHYSQLDGLSANKIRGIDEDRQGVLWLATNIGLIKYDGFRFQNLNLNSDVSSFSYDLSSLAIDKERSKVWITTYNDGLLVYDIQKPIAQGTKNYHAYVGKEKIIKKELYTVIVARSGLVYFGGQETDLQYYDPRTDRIYHVRLDSLEDHHTIFGLKEDSEGKIWIGTRYGGLFIYDPIKKNAKNINLYNKGENGARAFTFVGDSVYFSYYNHNLSKIHKNDSYIKTKNLLKLGINKEYYDNEISDICWLGDDSKLLISHVKHGMYLYDIRTEKFDTILWNTIIPDKNMNTRINKIYTNASGIYLGTDEGLFFYAPKLNIIDELITIKKPIKELFKVGQQNWYLSDHDIGKLNPDLNKILSNIPLKGLKVSQVHVIDDVIYLSTYDKGVYLVDIAHHRVEPLPILGVDHGFRNADCNTIIGDSILGESILWIGSWNSGLYRYHLASKQLFLFNKDNGLIDNKIITVGKDAEDRIWLGMDGFGVVEVKDKQRGVFATYHHDPNNKITPNSNTIFEFFLDKYKGFWYGSTASGIGQIVHGKKNQFIYYPDANRYQWMYTKRMKNDKYGRIWMKTSDGVMLFDPILKTFQHLYPGEGIYPASNFITYNFFFNENDIVWITDKGFVKGSLKHIKTNNIVTHKPIVTGFRIFNQDHSYKLYSDKIILLPNENSFSLYLSCPQVIDSRNIKYAYKLEGIDADWIVSDEYQQAIYTNVAAGTYTFRLKLGDIDGRFSDNISTYTIVVKSLWYQSKTFKFISFGLFFLLIVGFFFYRIQQQKAINKLHKGFNEKLKFELSENEKQIIEQTKKLEIERKEKLESEFRKLVYESELKAIRSQMNPHFIFNVLNSIEAYVVENDKHKASKLIHKFASLSRLILENSQNATVTIKAELDLVVLYLDLERERFDNMFAYEVEVISKLDLTKEKIPSMLIQPIVENAIHHGIRHRGDKDGKIKIIISSFDHFIQIVVLDNGVGFDSLVDQQSRNQSFGLKGIKNRLKMLNKEHEKEFFGIFINDDHIEDDFKTKIKIILPSSLQ